MEHVIPGDHEQIYDGKTTISPEVLLTIVQLTTSNVPGVSGMSNVPGGVNRLFKRGYGEGVRIDIQDDVVYADLYLIFKKDVNIRDVGRRVQSEGARACSEMLGMQVGRVNIHVEDIDYSDFSTTEKTEDSDEQ